MHDEPIRVRQAGFRPFEHPSHAQCRRAVGNSPVERHLAIDSPPVDRHLAHDIQPVLGVAPDAASDATHVGMYADHHRSLAIPRTASGEQSRHGAKDQDGHNHRQPEDYRRHDLKRAGFKRGAAEQEDPTPRGHPHDDGSDLIDPRRI